MMSGLKGLIALSTQVCSFWPDGGWRAVPSGATPSGVWRRALGSDEGLPSSDLDEPEIEGRRICCRRHHPECMTAISGCYKLKPELKRAFGVVIFATGEQITAHAGIGCTMKGNFRSFLWRLRFFSPLIVEDKALRALFQPYFVLLTATIAVEWECAAACYGNIVSRRVGGW